MEVALCIHSILRSVNSNDKRLVSCLHTYYNGIVKVVSKTRQFYESTYYVLFLAIVVRSNCTTKLVSRLLMKTCHKNGLQSATKEMDSEVRRRPHKCTYHVWYSRKPLPQACQRFWLYMCKNTDLNGILKTRPPSLTLVGNLSLEEKLFSVTWWSHSNFSLLVNFSIPSLWHWSSPVFFDASWWMLDILRKVMRREKISLATLRLMGHWGYQQWNSELFMLHFLRANRRISKLLRPIF